MSCFSKRDISKSKTYGSYTEILSSRGGTLTNSALKLFH